MYGMTAITPVINPPQAAILGVGAIRDVLARGADGEIVDRTLMTLTLSCDHRILYGADAAHFLAAIRAVLESPAAWRCRLSLKRAGEGAASDSAGNDRRVAIPRIGKSRPSPASTAESARLHRDGHDRTLLLQLATSRGWTWRQGAAGRRGRGVAGRVPIRGRSHRPSRRSRPPRRCWTPVMRSASTCSASASTIRRPPTGSPMTTGRWRRRSTGCRPRRGCRWT